MSSQDDLLWLLAVHHLGWRKVRGQLLLAERCVWFKYKQKEYFFTYDTKDLQKFLASQKAKGIQNKITIPPDFFYSFLKQDVFRASALAIETILGMVPTINATQNWLKVTEAAKLLMQDLPWLKKLANARARVSAAANHNKFTTNGNKGPKRRIEPNSFSTWRLQQRDKGLEAEDKRY